MPSRRGGTLAAQVAYVSPMQLAQLHALLGERDPAFAALERAFAERSPALASLRVSPVFDDLRSDPRYAKLLARMRLAP